MPNIDLGVRPLGTGNLGAEINSLQASRATAGDVRGLHATSSPGTAWSACAIRS